MRAIAWIAAVVLSFLGRVNAEAYTFHVGDKVKITKKISLKLEKVTDNRCVATGCTPTGPTTATFKYTYKKKFLLRKKKDIIMTLGETVALPKGDSYKFSSLTPAKASDSTTIAQSNYAVTIIKQ